MMKKTIYISGPMSGLPGENREEFLRVEEELKAEGYQVINPVRISDALVKSGFLKGMTEKEKYNTFIREDLRHVPLADEMYMLRDWDISEGAFKEFTVAKFCNHKFRFQK